MDLRQEMATQATGSALSCFRRLPLYREKRHRPVHILWRDGQQLARMPGPNGGASEAVPTVPSGQPETDSEHRQYGNIPLLSPSPGVTQPAQTTAEDDPQPDAVALVPRRTADAAAVDRHDAVRIWSNCDGNQHHNHRPVFCRRRSVTSDYNLERVNWDSKKGLYSA